MHDHKPNPQSRPATGAAAGRQPADAEEPEGSHSMWWMVACCAPMVLIGLAILLGLFGTR
jgi:hypothetical protein